MLITGLERMVTVEGSRGDSTESGHPLDAIGVNPLTLPNRPK
jgi:hypothetical protein